jgi:hypothetical protein
VPDAAAKRAVWRGGRLGCGAPFASLSMVMVMMMAGTVISLGNQASGLLRLANTLEVLERLATLKCR